MEDSLSWIEKALAEAEPKGYIRVFIEQGIEVERLLERIARSEIILNEHDQKKYSNRFLQQIITAFHPMQFESAQKEEKDLAQSPHPIQKLTQRETEVLGLMTSGKSIKEIASIMMISINTAKTYVKRIYRKLDVHKKYDLINQTRSCSFIKQYR
jgi:LuxR family transcriptional regulator, maltose regulon positive regulatory protein